jgi:hypothetical protein
LLKKYEFWIKKIMRIAADTLIDDLIDLTRNNINQTEKFKQLSLSVLNRRTAPDAWSILECFEHLNLYGDYYLPEIAQQIEKNTTRSEETFNTGLLGNYFAKSMQPKAKLNKMKTFKDKNPLGGTLDKLVIEKFLVQQDRMLSLLADSRQVSLNKIKTGVSISKWIKLKLGDTFRVVIYHNERHIAQANKLFESFVVR